MLPYRDDTVTELVLRIIGIIPPSILILIFEWTLLRKERSARCFSIPVPWWVRSSFGILMSFSVGFCFNEIFTNMGKKVIGRLRPHFFDLCKPSVDCSLPTDFGRYIAPNEYTCTAETPLLTDNLRKSFPSGHSSSIAYTAIFIAIYLERRSVWKNHRIFRHTIQLAFLLMSWYVALSRITDFKHHWSDVLCGYALGMFIALFMAVRGTELIEAKKNNSSPAHEVNLNHQELPISA
ncbi:putative phosphatidate phosphatase isoform X2 [Bombyx mori]